MSQIDSPPFCATAPERSVSLVCTFYHFCFSLSLSVATHQKPADLAALQDLGLRSMGYTLSYPVMCMSFHGSHGWCEMCQRSSAFGDINNCLSPQEETPLVSNRQGKPERKCRIPGGESPSRKMCECLPAVIIALCWLCWRKQAL